MRLPVEKDYPKYLRGMLDCGHNVSVANEVLDSAGILEATAIRAGREKNHWKGPRTLRYWRILSRVRCNGARNDEWPITPKYFLLKASAYTRIYLCSTSEQSALAFLASTSYWVPYANNQFTI